MTHITLTNPSTTHATFLRRALIGDAAISAGTGLMLLAGAGLVSALLGVPAGLMRWSGLSLLPFAALVAWLATRPNINVPAVWAVIAYNLLWTVDSIVLLLSGLIAPSRLGEAFVIFQAAVVAGFAGLEY